MTAPLSNEALADLLAKAEADPQSLIASDALHAACTPSTVSALVREVQSARATIAHLQRSHHESEGAALENGGRACDMEMERDELRREAQTARRALEVIAEWDPKTFPRIPDRDDTARTWSFGASFGSNGERDFMRSVARYALTNEAQRLADFRRCLALSGDATRTDAEDLEMRVLRAGLEAVGMDLGLPPLERLP